MRRNERSGWTGTRTLHGDQRALRAQLGLVPIMTPAYSPESNGLAEAFVHTFKRAYVNGAELRDAEVVLAQLGEWLEDYNRQVPHSALGMRPPTEYRATLELTSPSV